MSNILDGSFISIDAIKAAIEKINPPENTPLVLILSENQWNRFINAMYLHRQESIAYEYRKLGIYRVVWSEDVLEGEFAIDKDKNISENCASLIIHENNKRRE